MAPVLRRFRAFASEDWEVKILDKLSEAALGSAEQIRLRSRVLLALSPCMYDAQLRQKLGCVQAAPQHSFV